MTPTQSDPGQYTDPALRDRIKKKVTAGSKGGKPGQWSARKAQLVAAEYKNAGGAYKHAEDESQKHLNQWTEEHWETSDGKPAIRKGATTRYLPAKAWDQLTDSEKAATNKKKVAGSRAGKQFVSNTGKAATARKRAVAKKKAAKSSSAKKAKRAPGAS